MSVDSLTMQLRELQAKLVKALQEEYFCEDLEPPPAAFGWDADALRKYFEDGGVEAAADAGRRRLRVGIGRGVRGSDRARSSGELGAEVFQSHTARHTLRLAA